MPFPFGATVFRDMTTDVDQDDAVAGLVREAHPQS